MSHQQNIQVLADYLEKCTERFSSYQEIPDFILAELGIENSSNFYKKNQVDLDGERLEFLTRNLDCNNLSVIEIGSNMGYFCLTLSHKYGCNTTGFEPLSDYAHAANLMARVGKISKNCKFTDVAISLNDIKDLPSANLYMELNVLHHAGAVFDRKEVTNAGGWRNYACARLSAIRKKADKLLFQTGNVANGQSLFPTEDAVSYMKNLLEEAGWNVNKVGTIHDLEVLEYEDHATEMTKNAKTYTCLRNEKTGLVDFYCNEKLSNSLLTGLANRPIWLCE